MSSYNPHTDEHVRFIAKHYKRNVFDPRKGWEKLSVSIPELGKPKRARLFPFIATAAAVAILAIGIGILLTPSSETLVAGADHTAFTLPDSSHIEMQKSATLHYAKNFGKTERRVAMTGEISFAVARDTDKPFIVSTSTAEVRVLGTEFTVTADEGETRLDVKSGRVQFTPQSPAIPLLCTAGMTVHYTAETENVHITSSDGFMEINGKNKSLVFHNTQLKDVALVLSHFYNVEIGLPQDEAGLTFTSSFTQKSVIEIVNIINLTLDTHLTIDN